MATVNLVLDTRRKKDDGTYPVKLVIRHKKKNCYISTAYSVSEKYWVNGSIKKGCKDIENIKKANNKLSSLLINAEDILEHLEQRNKLDRLDVKQIAEIIKNNGQKVTNISFNEYLKTYIDTICKENNKQIYHATLTAIENYSTEPVYFDEMNKAWLYRFKEWRLKDKKANTVNINLRNIRTMFNRAIDVDEIIEQDLYPFRKFEFAKATTRNLRLSIDQIRCIRDFKFEDEHLQLAQDFFMLSFYLIGINNSDLFDATGIVDNRLDYERNKTQKVYSIKVEPEAMEIINRRRGEEKFLIYQERYKNHNLITRQVNKHLKTIAKSINNYLSEKEKQESIKIDYRIPEDLIMYYARHAWAGLAAKKPVGASKYMIAQALGHGKKTVTDTYFDYDNELVDDLNRKVLDLLSM